MSSIVKASPTSPGRRFSVRVLHPELHKGKPFEGLLKTKKRTGGRNNQGRITCRHIGGGHKKKYRLIDFKRDKESIPAVVERLEYDPNRSAHIALLLYADGERRYIIAPKGLSVGDAVLSSADAPIKVGNCLPIQSIPIGSVLHCVEMIPNAGAKIARSAGAFVQLVAKEDSYAILRMKSGEIRKILALCKAVIGEVGNSKHNLVSFGKAGAKRHLGIRPTVRGTAMNPIDHPHGGGEGKTKGGRNPVTPWGVPTKGYKTRRNKRTDKYIQTRIN